MKARSHFIKWSIWSLVALLSVGAACVSYGLWRAWQKFTNEERICGSFHPVISALDDFQQNTGSFPTNIHQLVPQYIQQLPGAPIADSIEYRILPDGTNWQLSVRSHVRGPSELFVQRSSGHFTDEERQQSVTGFHGWLVFRDR